ncbi:MAG: DNA polymerase IV [Eubacteriales bacterium]|nr:DNA polymerase IV [Eubacteriales bacterium]
MKLICHIDVNSAFLSWTACAGSAAGQDPDIRDVASVIGGSEKNRHGIVLAKSVRAKECGIQTGEPLFQARRKCPGLVVVPPDYRLYVQKSDELIRLLHEYTPKVEQYSIDEAWIDMSGIEHACRAPERFAVELKDRIRRELGFTVNVGVSTNHLLAKMASELKKPDMVHTLFPEEIERKLWPLPVEDLFFVGRSTAGKLHTLGIHTIGELAGTDPGLLEYHLKKHGRDIWSYANGGELDASVFERAKTKGYSNETTVSDDVTDMDTACQVILSLCETVGARLRQDGMKASVVGVHVKDSGFTDRSRQTSLGQPTNSTNLLYEESRRLFRELWDGRPLRLIGVFTSKAEQPRYEQLDLFETAKNEKQERLDRAIDQIREKFGEDSVRRARFLDSEFGHMAGGLGKEKRRRPKM